MSHWLLRNLSLKYTLIFSSEELNSFNSSSHISFHLLTMYLCVSMCVHSDSTWVVLCTLSASHISHRVSVTMSLLNKNSFIGSSFIINLTFIFSFCICLGVWGNSSKGCNFFLFSEKSSLWINIKCVDEKMLSIRSLLAFSMILSLQNFFHAFLLGGGLSSKNFGWGRGLRNSLSLI